VATLKVAHWVLFNSSGMFRCAESFVRSECQLGIQSYLVDFGVEKEWEDVYDADVHVVHTHLPDLARKRLTKPLKLVWIGHGTPEYTFTSSVIQGIHDGYGAGDSWQLIQYWMQNADALVTFWPRHQKIWKSLCDKKTQVDCIPMGVEKSFWQPTQSRGKYIGSPSLFTAENPDYSKWPLDLFIMWPWVWNEVPTAHLHSVYMPNDMMRWFLPLVNRNGAGFKTIISNTILAPENLRNALVSTDYFIGLVRYGDCNLLARQANACGCKLITYRGNEYADYWLTEGDQRIMAKELIAILKGDVAPRKDKKDVCDISETSQHMIKIYERIA